MTETLQSQLASGAGSGIYRFGGRTSANKLAKLAGAAGWQFIHLDASQVRDKPGFLSAAAQTLAFPGWAGHNWDAFEELVNDLSWLPPARGYLLLIDRLGKFSQRQPDAVRMSLEILETAAAGRQRTQLAPLLVLVRGAGSGAKHLPALALDSMRPNGDATTEQQDA